MAVGAAAPTRRRELRRIQGIATGLLGLMAVVFVAASLALRPPMLAQAAGYVRAFAEAAMVGACADWFAVTALFRQPFGLPIPHTAVVSRNKDRIGRALGDFIADNFLTVRVLDDRLRQLGVARWGAGWLRDPANARGLALRLARLAPDLVEALPAGALRALAGEALVSAVRAAPAAPLASRLLAIAWREGQAHRLVEQTAAALGGWLAEREGVILQAVRSQSYTWLPAWVDRMIAQKLTASLIKLLADLGQPDHPWRPDIARTIDGWIAKLASDPELRARGEALKRQLLENDEVREQMQAVWTALERGVASALRDNVASLADSLEHLLVGLGERLDEDAGVQRALELWARAMVRRVIAPRRHEIGGFVAQVVAGWDAQSMVDKLELQAGPDLQYIRINGTLVGGLVGLLIYSLSRAVGL